MAQVLADPTSAANLAALRPSATPLCVVASLPGAAACATARRLRDFVVRALRNSTLKVRLKVRSGWTGLLVIFLCICFNPMPGTIVIVFFLFWFVLCGMFFLNLGMVVQLTRWHPTTLSLRSWIWICKTLLVHPFDMKHLELRRSDDMTMGCHWWDGVALLGADLGEWLSHKSQLMWAIDLWDEWNSNFNRHEVSIFRTPQGDMVSPMATLPPDHGAVHALVATAGAVVVRTRTSHLLSV